MHSDSGNDPEYYKKKRDVEKELGRELTTAEFQENYYEGSKSYRTGTSIFDPVLCELMYKWFCPINGKILDPFSGGSVRGIVANYLGYHYTGIDLSEAQIAANNVQAEEIIPENKPTWIVGDSNQIEKLLPEDYKADFVFSCPPYHDLEKYSDDMDDLSNMSWDTFKRMYRSIIEKACWRLNSDRFACFVITEIRYTDSDGFYKGFVPWTIQCFREAGLSYYNEAILVNTAGSLPIRVAKQFSSSRKLGRTHQNVLIFYKGDTSLIPRRFKGVDSTFILNNYKNGSMD
jgi:DNA modification methylase